MMITTEQYSIYEYIYENKLVIQLPQTLETITNSMYGVSNRKVRLSGDELLLIATIVEKLYEYGETPQYHTLKE